MTRCVPLAACRWRVNMKTTFRLSVLVLLLLLAVLPGALSGSGPAIAGDSGGELRVVDWPGLQDPVLWADFKNKYPHVTVHFDIKQSDAAIYTWVATLRKKADIIHPYSSWLKRWVDEGLVEEITTKELGDLANWNKIPKRFQDIGKFNGKQYFIPWDIGLSSILYRTDKVEQINSWDALFNSDYKRHISMFSDGPSAVSVSCYIHGWKEKDITPENLKVIGDDWIEQRKINLKYWEDENKLINAMANGNVWVAYAWPSAYDAVKAELKKKGVEVKYADPKEGRASWVGVYGILKGTKEDRKKLALEFLDEKLSEMTANNLVENWHYAVANQDVMRRISDPTVKELFPDDLESLLDSTNFTPELTEERLDDWSKMWSQVK